MHRHLRRRPRTSRVPSRHRAGPGTLHAELPLHGHTERQAPRLLPLDLHRPRRRAPDHRHHAVRIGRRPALLPVLRRAGPQGGLRDRPHRRPRRGRHLELPCRWHRRTGHQAARPLLPHHEDVDLPGRLRRWQARSHRDDRCRRCPAAGRVHPGKKALGQFALDIGAFALRFFAEYFNIAYPGEKVDLVAIPDFAAGAMENLGCITFRDTALLIDESQAARTELERVADVIADELAHMWFGDLVTMGWWEGIWLNEAFATFMEMLCVDAFRPSWDRWVGFVPSREAALTVDAVHATRPIEYPVGPPKEAEGMFDLLTYEKGCGVLRMLEQRIGPNMFRDSVPPTSRPTRMATPSPRTCGMPSRTPRTPVHDVMNTFILRGGRPGLAGDTLGPQPFALGPVPPVPPPGSGAGGRCRSAVPRALPRPGPPEHLVLGPIRRGAHDRRGHAAGECRRTGMSVLATSHPPSGDGRAALHADAARAGQPARRRLGRRAGRHHPRCREFLDLASRLDQDADPAPWAPVASAFALTNRDPPATTERATLHRAASALFGPTLPRPGLRAPSPARAAHPSLRRWPSMCCGPWGPTHRFGPRRSGGSTSHQSGAATEDPPSRPTSGPPP